MKKTNVFYAFIFLTLLNAEKMYDNVYYLINNQNKSFTIKAIEKYSENINVAHLNPAGFIIYADKVERANILGYSFQNNYNKEKNSENFKYLLDNYQNDFHLNINMQNYNDNLFYSNRDVEPLLSAMWDQGYPFNGMCPSGPPGSSMGDAVVGCVAVGMAQVMHYWQYPPVGIGNNSYYSSNYGEIFADFENTDYNYSMMSNLEGNEEVQELLFHCGVAVEMDYGPNGSGAAGGPFTPLDYPSAFSALQENFGYLNTMEFIEKNNYSDDEWFEIIKDELNNNRPIIYDACANVGCHTWNVDGYQGDYIHCNWGWGGFGNGYFLLNTLNPEPGINFNDDVWAIVGIEPGNIILLGDINEDETINIQDIILCISIILNGDSYNEYADLNQDFTIDILDIVILTNIILGIN